MLGVKERLDRSMRMDIKALGWHLTADRTRVASDTSKLRLLQEVCKNQYPEYVEATQQALNNISKDNRENAPAAPTLHVPAAATHDKIQPPQSAHGNKDTSSHGHDSHAKQDKSKRPGLFGMFKSFRKSRDNIHKPHNAPRSASMSPPIQEAPRSLSDSGPVRDRALDEADMEPLEPIRSKSVGAILEEPALHGIDEEIARNRLEQLTTSATVQDEGPSHTDGLEAYISRHDQYHGIGRVATKDLRQADASY